MKKLVVLVLVAGLAAVAAPAQALNPPQKHPEGVTALLSPSIDSFWAQTLAAAGKQYRTPTEVRLYRGSTMSGCGLLLPGNSYFCGVGDDRRIYLDYAWHQTLIDRFGDYGSGFVLAHEWGHHVQDLLGWHKWAGDRGYYAGRELQADCYAGVYTRYAYNSRLASQHDYDEALAWLAQFGDEFHWRHPYAHGQSWLRGAWFEYGFAYSSPAGCDLVYQRLYAPGAKPREMIPPTKPVKKPVKPHKKHRHEDH